MADNWISPTGHSDPSSKWSKETNSYDGNTGTKASCNITVSSGSGRWGAYLEFSFDEISSDKVRVYSSRDYSNITNISIDYYKDSTWTNFYQGSLSFDSFETYEIGETVKITGVRVRYYNDLYNGTMYAYLHEIGINSLATGLPVIFNGAEISKWNDAEISKWNGVG